MGPFLYDIAMEYVGQDGLMSDRTSVSEDALNVWKFYLESRPDVVPKQLDNKGNPFITPKDPKDDCTQRSFVNKYFSKAIDRSFDFEQEEDREEYMDSPLTKAYVKKGGSQIIDALQAAKKIYYKESK